MSKVRGVFPLFLVTALGIVNGVWVFGPALKDQEREKEEERRKAKEIGHLSKDGIMSLRDAEAAASRAISKESALKGDSQSSSDLGLWFGGSAAGPNPTNTPQAQSQGDDKRSRN